MANQTETINESKKDKSQDVPPTEETSEEVVMNVEEQSTDKSAQEVEAADEIEASDDAQKPETDDQVASESGDEDADITTETSPEDDNDAVTVDDNNDNGDVAPSDNGSNNQDIDGIAAYFDLPAELMAAAEKTRDSDYAKFEAYSPFPIHGMDDAMGIGRSWLPWVTFGAGMGGFLTANALQFGTMVMDWPMVIGGKPLPPVPSFVPIMFELSVLFGGVTTALVMFIASGCFRKARIIDPEITNDRFVLWISADDKNFDIQEVKAFMETLNPVEIKTVKIGA